MGCRKFSISLERSVMEVLEIELASSCLDRERWRTTISKKRKWLYFWLEKNVYGEDNCLFKIIIIIIIIIVIIIIIIIKIFVDTLTVNPTSS